MDVKSLTGGFAQFNDLDIVCVLPSKLTGCFSLKARAVSTGRCVTTESHCSSPSQRSHAASQDSASLQMTDSSIFTEAIHEQKKKKGPGTQGPSPPTQPNVRMQVIKKKKPSSSLLRQIYYSYLPALPSNSQTHHYKVYMAMSALL